MIFQPLGFYQTTSVQPSVNTDIDNYVLQPASDAYMQATNMTTNWFATLPRTVECWIYNDITVNNNYIFSSRDNTGDGRGVGIQLNDGGWAVVYFGNAGYSGTYTFSQSGWYHIAVVIRSSEAELFVNGTSEDTISVGTPLNGRDDWDIGVVNKFTDRAEIAELRFWNDERTASEISNYANVSLIKEGTIPSELHAYFPMNAISSRTITDESGNGRDISIIGGTPDTSIETISPPFNTNDYP